MRQQLSILLQVQHLLVDHVGAYSVVGPALTDRSAVHDCLRTEDASHRIARSGASVAPRFTEEQRLAVARQEWPAGSADFVTRV